jgi:hypothetical protein
MSFYKIYLIKNYKKLAKNLCFLIDQSWVRLGQLPSNTKNCGSLAFWPSYYLLEVNTKFSQRLSMKITATAFIIRWYLAQQ